MIDETPTPVSDSVREYQRRVADHGAEEERTGRRAARLSVARLVVFLAAVGAVVAAASGWVSWHVLWLFGVAFFTLVVFHQRALRGQWVSRRLREISEQGLRRIEDRWSGTGDTGESLRPEGHVFADDLDLFGRGSLFELLCTARTGAGRERLAGWLLAGAAVDEIRARQEAIDELRSAVDLREQMAMVGGEASSALDRSSATTWGETPRRLTWPPLALGARVLGIGSGVLFVGWVFGGWSLLPLLGCLLAQFLLTVPFWGRVGAVLDEADRPSQDLALVGRLLRILEAQASTSPWLRGIARELAAEGLPPSKRIARLTRLMDFVEARRNQIFLPISWLFCLGTQLAFAIESWREENGRALVDWVEALGSFEAIVAFSGYAYEHSEDPFPEIVEHATVFEATGLGHPLLGGTACIRNDVVLRVPPEDASPQAMLVSGSNMSGKSTLLRTVGVNAVLAQAGAPVRAKSLRIGSLAVGASIRIHDSLQAGESRFYAEIARLRKITDLTLGDVPVLFLLDEMLHGTNSHDRRIGAEAVIRSLLEAGAVGLVTTHDLALAEIADADARMINVHFEDRLEEGRILFDYRLRDGVVRHSNAIALMRSVGLTVE